MSDRQRPPAGHRTRRSFGRAQDSGRDDPYGRSEKLRDPSVCRQCRAIAEAIRHAHQGELTLHFDEDGYSFRATWTRDA